MVWVVKDLLTVLMLLLLLILNKRFSQIKQIYRYYQRNFVSQLNVVQLNRGEHWYFIRVGYHNVTWGRLPHIRLLVVWCQLSLLCGTAPVGYTSHRTMVGVLFGNSCLTSLLWRVLINARLLKTDLSSCREDFTLRFVEGI